MTNHFKFILIVGQFLNIYSLNMEVKGSERFKSSQLHIKLVG
jgi:hypothetical protein